MFVRRSLKVAHSNFVRWLVAVDIGAGLGLLPLLLLLCVFVCVCIETLAGRACLLACLLLQPRMQKKKSWRLSKEGRKWRRGACEQ